MRNGLFAASGGVLNAQSPAAGVDPIDAVVRADALADIVAAPFGELLDQIGIRHLRPGHADQIDVPICNGARRGVYVGNALRLEHRQVDRGPDVAGEMQEGAIGCAMLGMLVDSDG